VADESDVTVCEGCDETFDDDERLVLTDDGYFCRDCLVCHFNDPACGKPDLCARCQALCEEAGVEPIVVAAEVDRG
jgi:hypothetical protein